MKRRTYLKSALFILLILPAIASAQSQAYAKFGSDGEIIGLFNLMKDTARCGNWQVFTGAVTSVRSEKRNKEFDYRFTLNTTGKLRIFTFTLGVDEIPRSDTESLVAKKRGIRVRACEGISRWIAEEIVRVEIGRSGRDPVLCDSIVTINRSR